MLHFSCHRRVKAGLGGLCPEQRGIMEGLGLARVFVARSRVLPVHRNAGVATKKTQTHATPQNHP